MEKSMLANKKLLTVLAVFLLALFLLFARVVYIHVFLSDFLTAKAYEQQTRDRLIAPNRGRILDRDLTPLATTMTVSSVSVIHNQLEDKEVVAQQLAAALDMEIDTVLEKVNRRVALERIATKVPLEIGAAIRELNLAGVVVDEDTLRVYPYSTLAAQVLGFVGRDNQGIVGLEARYDTYLRGTPGRILTETDVRGLLVNDSQTFRLAPVDGYHLVTHLDVTIQQYAEQTIATAVAYRQAKRGSIIVMNPNSGAVYAMANYPDFDLNDPFTINDEALALTWRQFNQQQQMDYLNQMWRNFSINDTFEPGSTFKIITAAMGMESGLLDLNTRFVCTGSHTVGGVSIRCWRHPRSHGNIDFLEGMTISCNPVFMVIGEQLGAERFFQHLKRLGLTEPTGIDLPGEAGSIMHKLDNVGPVELATMSFGQSFQITPLQLLASVSSIINGGYRITPHVGSRVVDSDGNLITDLTQPQGERVVGDQTVGDLRLALENVVYDGTGNKAYLPGFRIGGKTATSEKLPRRQGRYIASFVSFAPAENPQVIAFVLIDEPQGAYYGGQVAGPVMKELLGNVLPHMGIEVIYKEAEQLSDMIETPQRVSVPALVGLTWDEAHTQLTALGLALTTHGEGRVILAQFPQAGEQVNPGQSVSIQLGD